MNVTPKALYATLSGKREPYVTRARSCAALTIPSLFPPEGTQGENLLAPYQGMGARAVKALSSKIFMALLPPEAPFFRLKLAPEEREGLSDKTLGQVEEALSQLERLVMDALETRVIRPAAYEAIKQLLVSGNVLMYLGPEKARVFRLDGYVVRRNSMGEVMDIIVQEAYRTKDLSVELSDALTVEQRGEEVVKLYTHITRVTGGWEATQWVEDVPVPGTKSFYAEGRSPWLPLRMVPSSGEDYGRSYVEEHIGDFQSLESLTKSINLAAKAAARIVFLVRPNGMTNVKAMNEAANGGFVPGNPDDIHCVQLDKQADLAIAKAEADQIRAGIAAAFLMTESIQRSGERVTAEEIKTMAAELESVLGGVYSLLSAEFQSPLVGVALGRLESEGAIPEFPKDTFKPSIITGMDAMGRGADLQRIITSINVMAPMGPAAMASIKMDELWKRVLASTGVEEKGLIKSQEEMQQEQKQAQAAELMSKLGPEALKQKGQQQPQAA